MACTPAFADEQTQVFPTVVMSPSGLIVAFYDREAAHRRVTVSAAGSRAPDGDSEPKPQRQLRRHGTTDVARDTPLMTSRGQAAAEVADDQRLLLTVPTGNVRVTITPVGMEGDRTSLPCSHGHGVVTMPRDAHVMGTRGRPGAEIHLLGADARVTSTAPRTVGGLFLPQPKYGQVLSDAPVRVTAAELGTVPRGIQVMGARGRPGTKGSRLRADARGTGATPGAVGGVFLPPPRCERALSDSPVRVTAAALALSDVPVGITAAARHTGPRGTHAMGACGRPRARMRPLGTDAHGGAAPGTVGGALLPPPRGERALSAAPVGVAAAARVAGQHGARVMGAYGGPTRGGRALPGVPIRVTAAALGAQRDVRVSEVQPRGCHLGARAPSAHEALKGVGALHRLPPPEGARGLPDPPVEVTAAGTGGGTVCPAARAAGVVGAGDGGCEGGQGHSR